MHHRTLVLRRCRRRDGSGFLQGKVDVETYICGAPAPVPGILFETKTQQVANARRQIWWKLRPVGVPDQNRSENIADIVSVERALTGHHFIKDAPESEDVG